MGRSAAREEGETIQTWRKLGLRLAAKGEKVKAERLGLRLRE